jgi:hypothetical protein
MFAKLCPLISSDQYIFTLNRKCGLFPMNPDALDYTKLLSYHMNEPSDFDVLDKEIAAAESEADKRILLERKNCIRSLECLIPKQILEQMKYLREEDRAWNGNEEYLALAKIWNKMMDEISTTSGNLCFFLSSVINTYIEKIGLLLACSCRA